MIEDLARESAAELRAGTASDVEAGLADLHVRRSEHRRRAGAGAAAALVLAVGVGWAAGSAVTRSGSSANAPVPPVGQPSKAFDVNDPCQRPNVTCLGNRTYRFHLDDPVIWRIPRPFGVDSGSGASENGVESYWFHDGIAAGVSVMEGVRAAAHRSTAHPAPGVAPTAAGFVHWLAGRPFLDATTPRRTTLDGHPAWQVRVSLRASAGQGPATCSSRFRCQPIAVQGPEVSGIWGDMVADYTVFDVPGRDPTLVWSWSFGHDTAALEKNLVLVDGLGFPGG